MKWFRRRREQARAIPAPRPKPQPVRDLFVDDEDAHTPVNLEGPLDVQAAPSPLGDVLQVLRGLLGAASDPGEQFALTKLEHVLRHGELRLPVMPQVALTVTRLFDAPNCDVAQLAREIERDPALATKVVGVANSPFYHGLEAISAVHDAVVRVGLRETRNVTLAIALRSRLFRVPGMEAQVQLLWQHALATSIAAQQLAIAAGLDPDPAFLLGLVHDVGRTVLLAQLGDLQRDRRAPSPIDPAALLEKMPDDLHALLGAVAAKSWRLSDAFISAIAHHHRPSGPAETERALTQLIHAADISAKRMVEGDVAPELSDEEHEAVFGPLGLERETVESIEGDALEAYQSLAKSL